MAAIEQDLSGTKSAKAFGLLGEFRSARGLYNACERVRDEGYTRWDAHSPFPIHGLEKAMGLRPSRLGWIVLASALTGAASGILLQWWVATTAYPLVISGKPLFSWQAFVPVTFELTVLFGAFGAVLGMLHLNRLPRFYHSVFRSERFDRSTDNRFFISIEAIDPKYDAARTAKLLEELGALHVETLED